MEKEYKFFIQKSGRGRPKTVIKKESELTEEDHSLLLGELVYMYDNMPAKVQQGFIIYMAMEGSNNSVN